MTTLSVDLSGTKSWLKGVEIEEANVIVVELEVQQTWYDYKGKKQSAKENVSRLGNSLKE